jgi:ribonuclease BN (tRNA processing enzyme)
MVDAGGGTFAQFHKADAQVSDVRLFAVSHFHPDHSSEIPALLWPEASTAHMAGPSGNDGYPSLDEFLDGLFGAPDAVFRVLGQRLNLSTTTVNVSAGQSVEVFSDEQIRVRGIGVPHGDVPTVGYRVDVGDASVGFSSDQNGTNPAYTALVRGVDLLIVHFAASETPVGRTAALHARPSVWGQMASDVQAGGVVLSHLSESKPGHSRHGSHSGSDLDGSVAHFRSRYDGPLMIAEDLMCIAIE